MRARNQWTLGSAETLVVGRAACWTGLREEGRAREWGNGLDEGAGSGVDRKRREEKRRAEGFVELAGAWELELELELEAHTWMDD